MNQEEFLPALPPPSNQMFLLFGPPHSSLMHFVIEHDKRKKMRNETFLPSSLPSSLPSLLFAAAAATVLEIDICALCHSTEPEIIIFLFYGLGFITLLQSLMSRRLQSVSSRFNLTEWRGAVEQEDGIYSSRPLPFFPSPSLTLLPAAVTWTQVKLCLKCSTLLVFSLYFSFLTYDSYCQHSRFNAFKITVNGALHTCVWLMCVFITQLNVNIFRVRLIVRKIR